jgi:hypothetical protein
MKFFGTQQIPQKYKGLKETTMFREQWLALVIEDTQEVEIGRIVV